MLEASSGETDRLGRLVADLLDVSRLQAGSASTALDWCEVEDLGPRRRGRGAWRGPAPRIETETDDALPLVRCDAIPDRARARQPDRERREVLARRVAGLAARPPAGRRPRGDLGHRPRPGIALDQRERVFEPFFRGRGGGVGGTGSGSRSRAGSSRPTRARWRSTMLPVEAHAAHRAAEPEGQRGGSSVSCRWTARASGR